tara:strand:+ start:732 stop:1421 length:690 start_codon:yes stop_codon:yes gene_type:complete
MNNVRPLPAFVRAELSRLADPAKAAEMTQYMKNVKPYYGVQSQDTGIITQSAFKKFRFDDEDELKENLLDLWLGSRREEQYVAVRLARKYPKFITVRQLPLYEFMLRTEPWWDTVDAIAGHLVGRAIASSPEKGWETVDKWIHDDSIWVQRTAILSQIFAKENTDERRLFHFCKTKMDDKQFFIAKAIGWALRQYGYVNPSSVRKFIAENEAYMSKLSVREALRNLPVG